MAVCEGLLQLYPLQVILANKDSMIKRVKWNILYSDDENTNRYDSSTNRPHRSYESNDDGASSSSDSNDSVQVGSKEADVILERLAKNDPNLYPNLDAEASSFHSDEDNDGDDSGADDENENSKDVNHQSQPSKSKSERFIYDKYCSLCPGKRMLNESDIETHLSSKKHLAAVRKHNKQKQHNLKDCNNDHQPKDAEAINTTSTANDTPTNAHEKRKKRQKTKLQCLQKRKKQRSNSWLSSTFWAITLKARKHVSNKNRTCFKFQSMRFNYHVDMKETGGWTVEGNAPDKRNLL